MPAPSTSTMSMSWAICETFRPACAASATSGPEIATAMNAGIRVMNGASTDRKISSSSTRMKTTVRASSWLPVDPDFFCWSTWMGIAPARCTWQPGRRPGPRDGAPQIVDQVGHAGLIALPDVGQHLQFFGLAVAGPAQVGDPHHRGHGAEVLPQRVQPSPHRARSAAPG